MTLLFRFETDNLRKIIHNRIRQEIFRWNYGRRCLSLTNSIQALFLGATTFCAALYSYPESHGPFEDGETPQSVPCVDCVLIDYNPSTGSQPCTWYYAAPHHSKKTTLKMERLGEANAYHLRITILDNHGRALSPSDTVAMPSDLFEVKSADLNQDGQPDFIVNLWNGGCGTASTISLLTFALSTGVKYEVTGIISYYFSSKNIVRFKKSGPCYLITTSLLGNGDERTKDGRPHNFWVYELHRFRGAEIVKANQDAPQFPKWVWYTFKDNHKETDQLTTAQKRRLLNAQ